MHDWKYKETVGGWDPDFVYECNECGAVVYTYQAPSKECKITYMSSILPGRMVKTDEEWRTRGHDFDTTFPKGASCEESIIWLAKWGIVR